MFTVFSSGGLSKFALDIGCFFTRTDRPVLNDSHAFSAEVRPLLSFVLKNAC